MKRLVMAAIVAVAIVAWWRRPRYADGDLAAVPPYDPWLWEVMKSC